MGPILDVRWGGGFNRLHDIALTSFVKFRKFKVLAEKLKKALIVPNVSQFTEVVERGLSLPVPGTE